MTKGKDVGGATMSSGVLEALLRAMTAEDAAHAFEPLLFDGVQARRDRGACAETIVAMLDPFARGEKTALQISGLAAAVVLGKDSPCPLEFKDLVSQAAPGGQRVPFMLAKKGESAEAVIAGFVTGWLDMEKREMEIVGGAGAAPCDLRDTPLEGILNAFANDLALQLKAERAAHVAWVVVDRQKRKAKLGWMTKEDVATKDLGIPPEAKADLLAAAPAGFGWAMASDEGATDGGPPTACVGLVMLQSIRWEDDLAKIMIGMVPALALRLKDGAEVAVLMVDRKNERLLVEGMTAAAALEWVTPGGPELEKMDAAEREDVMGLVKEFTAQLARRPELPGLGVCLAMQDRGPGPFGIVGWASPEPVADAAQREAMIKAAHADGRKWKNATDLTPPVAKPKA